MITVTRGDDFHRKIWMFQMIDRSGHVDIILDSYTVEDRPSKRHSFKRVHLWNRMYQRDNTITYQHIPKPDDVLAEVRNRLSEVVTVAWEK